MAAWLLAIGGLHAALAVATFGTRGPDVATVSVPAAAFFLLSAAVVRILPRVGSLDGWIAIASAVIIMAGAVRLAITADPIAGIYLALPPVFVALTSDSRPLMWVATVVSALTWATLAGPFLTDPSWLALGLSILGTALVGSVIVAQRISYVAGLRDSAAREGRLRRQLLHVASDAQTEREQLQRILAATGDGICVQDRAGRAIFANDAAIELFGYPPELLGETAVHDLVHPVRSDGTPCTLEECPCLGPPFRGEVAEGVENLRCADGTLVPIRFVSAPLFEEDHRPRVVTIFHDITDETGAAEALRDAQSRYHTLFDTAPVGLVVVTTDLRIAEANPTFADLLGYEPFELIGREVATVTAPEDLPATQEIRDALGTAPGDGRRVEKRYLHKDGTRVRATVASAAIRDPHGAASRAIAVVEDVTQQRTLEERERKQAEEVRRLAARLEGVNAELDAYARTVAHDLRAPLRGVLQLADLVIEDERSRLSPVGADLLARMRAECVRMQDLIDTLLTFSRIDAEAFAPQPLDLTRMAREIADDLTAEMPTRRVVFVAEDGLSAVADPKLVRIVLVNLLRNAWKFTTRTLEPRVHVGAREVGDEPVFYVRDNGIGFRPEQAGRLFEPFRRLHGDVEFPGTGVGLATVRRIIARHGGRVWAEGHPDEGATFYFTLPPPVEAPGRRTEAQAQAR